VSILDVSIRVTFYYRKIHFFSHQIPLESVVIISGAVEKPCASCIVNCLDSFLGIQAEIMQIKIKSLYDITSNWLHNVEVLAPPLFGRM
jgi:hypothetical protein